jgi:CBS domain-containing protein
MADTARYFLEKTRAKDLVKGQKIITAQLDDPISKAFKILIDHKISALPIKDGKNYEWIGIIDILHFATENTDPDVLAEGFKNAELQKLLNEATCEEIANHSQMNDFYSLPQDTHLKDVIDLVVGVRQIFRQNTQRFGVRDKSGSLVGVLSRSSIVHFLAKNLDKFSHFVNKSLTDLKFGFRDVVSVPMTSSAAEAFEIITKQELNGVAVVDEQGVLHGNLSVSDLKLIGYNFEILSNVLKPLSELLPHAKSFAEVLTISPSTTVAQLVQKFESTHVHRLYTVDENRKPIGVITLYDVIRLFRDNC